jgi:type I restriction enzyme S subunit
MKHSAAELLPAGTVVLSRTASVGFSGIMPAPMATSQDFWNWVCGPDLLPEYLNYQFKTMGGEFASLNLGSTHQTIYQKDAANLRILVPPLDEQQAIVDFLDEQTSRIDTLIDKQTQLITTLGERRSAVGENLVVGAQPATKGQRLKHVTVEVRQGWSPQCYSWPAPDYETWAVLKAGAANSGRFRPHENKELPADLEPRPETLVKRGDLVVSRANTRGLVGSAAVVTDDYPRLMLSDKLYAFRLDRSRALPQFVGAKLATRAIRGLIEVAAGGTSPSMQNISREDIGNLPMDLPTLDDQERILQELNERTSRIDGLIAKAEEHIALAKERRAALIIAAVTGQIDVRTAERAATVGA